MAVMTIQAKRAKKMKIPKKPTREMIQAGAVELKEILEDVEEWACSYEDSHDYVKRIWEKMIEAIEEENGE